MRILLPTGALAATLVVSGLLGWPLVGGLLSLVHRPHGSRAPDSSLPMPSVDPGGVLHGGKWIGLLERIAVTSCLIAGYPAGVAVVVAVKGLGRFGELRSNPVAAELFVIGSLASLMWAAVWGVVGLKVLELAW
jgi:hypothetical protein